MTIVERFIPIDARLDWSEALIGIKHGFAHTWEHNYAMQLSTGYPTHLYLFQQGDARIVCPIAERSFEGTIDLVTPYGFSGFVGNAEAPEFREHSMALARKNNYVCGYFATNPVFHNDAYFHANEVHQYGIAYLVDLTLTGDRLFKNLHTNRKRQFSNYERSFANLVMDKKVLTRFFLANYRQFFARKSAAAVYQFSPETIEYLLACEDVLLVGAQADGEVTSVSVFAWTQYAADYLFNVCLPEFRHEAALLLWYGVHHLKALGIPILNLGGGIRHGDGVSQFKERFGPRLAPLVSVKQVYADDRYEELCKLARTDPLDRTGYFPAYRKELAGLVKN